MNGILSQSAEQYFAAAGISRSSLEWIHPPKTPMHFKAKFIDKVIPDDETPAQRIGRITHRAILEPDTMEGAFHIKPEGMNFATKAGKEWKESRQKGIPIITSEEAKAIGAMRDAVWSDPFASRLLKNADYERSAFVEEDGLLLKARFDAFPRAGNVIPDVKTCESADLDSVEKAIAEHGYYRQASFYLRVADLLRLGREKFIFIFVEKTPPYAVACYELPDNVLQAGEMTIDRDLQTLRNCFATGKWPGYPTGLNVAGLPAWMMKKLEQELPA